MTKSASNEVELEELESFVSGSGAGRYVFNLLNMRAIGLRDAMIQKLRNHEDRKAGELREAMEECLNLKNLINQRIKLIRESHKEK